MNIADIKKLDDLILFCDERFSNYCIRCELSKICSTGCDDEEVLSFVIKNNRKQKLKKLLK